MCDKLGISAWEVIEAAATKPFAFLPHYPGPGLGGDCIPIVPHYLAWRLREYGYSAQLIEAAHEVNARMPIYVVQKIARRAQRRRPADQGLAHPAARRWPTSRTSTTRASRRASRSCASCSRAAGTSPTATPGCPSSSSTASSTPASSGRRSASREADCVVLLTPHRRVPRAAALGRGAADRGHAERRPGRTTRRQAHLRRCRSWSSGRATSGAKLAELALGRGRRGRARRQLVRDRGASSWSGLEARGARVETADIRGRRTSRSCSRSGPTACFLLAAQASRPLAESEPDYTEETNVTGARHVAEAVAALRASRSSTAARCTSTAPSSRARSGRIIPTAPSATSRTSRRSTPSSACGMYARRPGSRSRSSGSGSSTGRARSSTTRPESQTVVDKFRRLAAAGEELPLDDGGRATIGVVHVEDAARILLESPALGARGRERGRRDDHRRRTSPRSRAASEAAGEPGLHASRTPFEYRHRLAEYLRGEAPRHRRGRASSARGRDAAARARPRGRRARAAGRHERAPAAGATPLDAWTPSTGARELIDGLRRGPPFRGRARPGGRARRPGPRRARERRHDPQPARGLPRARRRARLSLDRPRGASSRRRTSTRCRSGSARSPAASTPRAAAVVRLTSVFGPGPGRLGRRDRRDRLRSPPRRSPASRSSSPATRERARDFVYVDDVVAALERIVAERPLERDAHGRERRRRLRCCARPSSSAPPPQLGVADRDAGRGAPARRERELRGGRDAPLDFTVRPLEEAIRRLCRLAPPPSRCSKPRPSLTRSPTASTAGLARARALPRAAARRDDDALARDGRCRVAAGPRRRGDRRGARRVAERRVRARRPARRRGARRHRAQRRVRRGDRLAGADDPPLRAAVAPTSSAPPARVDDGADRASSCASTPTPARRAGVTPLIENVPPVLRMRTGGVFLSPIGGHWRDLLALARARPGARLHLRHLACRAVPLVRRRVSRAVRARLGRGSRPRALRRGARAGGRGRARLRRARPARRGAAVRLRRARSRPGRPAARRARPVHRRGDQRARPRALAAT